MDKKNFILLVILLSFFAVDIIKVKYYPEESVKQIKTNNNEEVESSNNKEITEEKLNELTEEDLKLDEEEESEETDYSNEDETEEIENTENTQTTDSDGDVKDKTVNTKKQRVNKKANKVNKKNNKKSVSNGVDKEGIIVLDILHCSSHQSNIDTLKKEILGNYTNIEITSRVDLAPLSKQLISKAVFIIQIIIAAICLGGNFTRPYLSMIIPTKVIDFIESKKLMFGIMAYFSLSSIQTSLLQTGAFEVFANEQLIFSKLETKKLPSLDDLVLLIEQLGLKLE